MTTPSLAEHVRALRFHGSHDKQSFGTWLDSHLDELQAADPAVLLPELDAWTAGQRRAADAYASAGVGEHVGVTAVPEGIQAAWHLYVVTHPAADAVVTALRQAGVESRSYYRVPIHHQVAMAPYRRGRPLPVTDELAATNLALPMSPGLTAQDAEAVVRALAAAV